MMRSDKATPSQSPAPGRRSKRRRIDTEHDLTSPIEENQAYGDPRFHPSNDNFVSAITEMTQLIALQLPEAPRAPETDYERDASVILVGMAGAGKKTLALIASLALSRRYVNFASFFEQRTGISPIEHLDQYGLASYRESELEITKILFNECRCNCIIGGLSELGSHAHGALLRAVAATNPVIYVRRAKEELRKFVSSDENKFHQWYRYRDALYSSCSSFDFYNITAITENGEGHSTVPTLKLKDTEIDFVRSLHRLFGRIPRLLYSVDPLSSSHTYALNVPLTWLETCTDYEELECGADTINFVVDVPDNASDLHDRVAKQMAYLRRKSRASIIFEARYSPQSPSAYWALLRLGLRCLPDMIVVDLRADVSEIKCILHTKSNVKKIGAFHHEAPWPASVGDSLWSSLYAKAKTLSCDALRISHHAQSHSDSTKCIAFAHDMIERFDIPIIAFNTGRLGRTSICFNSILSPTVPPSMISEGSGVTVKQAQSALYSCFIASKKTFTIFGRSVSYSLSPAMHNAAFEAIGMPHTYNILQTDHFSQIRKLFEDENCAGVAVTLPYKTDALQLLDYVSDDARDIGAVNTITIERPDTPDIMHQPVVLRGYNTDHVGIRECIYRKLSPANLIRTNTSALILGAGGMARAAIYACQTLGVKHFSIYNRTFENAATLARNHAWSSANIHILRAIDDGWPSHLQQPTIIVSTIPAHGVGTNAPHELELSEKWLQSRTGGVFVELAYKPVVTRFIRQMQSMASRGWITVDGLDVLVEQGIAQFEIFTGRPAPVHTMRRAIRQQYELVSQQEFHG